jgi:MFS family permease
MQKLQVKIGEWIEKGFNLYKANFGLLVLASIIAVVLSVVTVGILAGPMIAGLALVILELLDRQEPKPEVGKVFKGFDYFVHSFLYFIVWGIAIIIGSIILGVIPCIGQLAAIFFVYAAQAFLMFGVFLIVDKHMDFWPASMESINTIRSNFWPFFGLSLLAGIIGSIGAIALGIGIVLTIPIQGCILAVAYREVFDGRGVTTGEN